MRKIQGLKSREDWLGRGISNSVSEWACMIVSKRREVGIYSGEMRGICIGIRDYSFNRHCWFFHLTLMIQIIRR